MKSKIVLCCLIFLWPLQIFAEDVPVAVVDGDTLTFTLMDESDIITENQEYGEHIFTLNTDNDSPKWARSRVTTVVFDSVFAKARPTTTYCWFYDMSYLESISGIEYLNTSAVTDMRYMFFNCSSLTNLDLSGFDTRNITNMSCMFLNCYNLQSLDVSSFNTAKVTDMSWMFGRCRQLTGLDVSTFDTRNVAYMNSMFFECKMLDSLDVSNFNTAKVTNMSDMFSYCNKLTKLDVRGFNTANVTNMQNLFFFCYSLHSLDVSGFNTSKVTNMSGMFWDCSSLISLDLSNFHTENVTTMSNMFNGCNSLTSLNVGSFKTDSVKGTGMIGMFNYCNNLTSLDLSSFNTERITDMQEMFYGCNKLRDLDLSSFNTENVTDMHGMFCDCLNLITLDLSNFNTDKVKSAEMMFYHCTKLKLLNLGNNDFYIASKSSAFDEVGTVASPCSLIISSDFSKSVLTKTSYTGIYSWKGGYFQFINAVDSIMLSTTELNITVGQIFRGQILTIAPDDAYQNLKIISEDDNVATVDSSGVITGGSVGTTNIKYEATDGSGVYALCKVNVYDKAGSLSLAQSTLTLNCGQSYTQQIATVLPTTAMQNIKASSGNDSIVTIDSSGVITGINPGITDIVYKAVNYDSTFVEAVCRVTVCAENVKWSGGVYYLLNMTDNTAIVTNIYGGQTDDNVPQYYSGSIKIPDSVVLDSMEYSISKVGDYAFYGQDSLLSVVLPDDINSIGTKALPHDVDIFANRGSSSLIAVWTAGYIPFQVGTENIALKPPFLVLEDSTQTTATLKIGNSYNEYAYFIGGDAIANNGKIVLTELSPEEEYTAEVNVCKSNDENIAYTIATRFTTAEIGPYINYESTATTIIACGAYAEGDAKVADMALYINEDSIFDVNEAIWTSLDPDSSYTIFCRLSLDDGTEYTKSVNAPTKVLSMVAQTPKVVKEGEAVVAVQTNLPDEERNVGFEWRRTDWTDAFTSKTAIGYLYEGKMEGYIKNLNTNYLWIFRPYYQSASGRYYFGEWEGIDPTNTSFFEPTVHTNTVARVEGNSVEVKGYAMQGTDNIVSEGFAYWKTGAITSNLNNIANETIVPVDAKTVEADGTLMQATIGSLDFNTTYAYAAFVTTSTGKTYYGAEQVFVIGEDPDGIATVYINTSDRQHNPIAIYDVQGRKLPALQKGVNIVRYPDGTTMKVLVK